MSGHYMDGPFADLVRWTKCVVSSRMVEHFIVSGRGGQASLYLIDLQDEIVKIGDFLEVTSRPDSISLTGNRVTGFRRCQPVCPRTVTTKDQHITVDLHLTVRFERLLSAGGPWRGSALYSSGGFVEVVDNRGRIPRSGRLSSSSSFHITAYLIRHPTEKRFVWVVADLLTDQKMAELSSKQMKVSPSAAVDCKPIGGRTSGSAASTFHREIRPQNEMSGARECRSSVYSPTASSVGASRFEASTIDSRREDHYTPPHRAKIPAPDDVTRTPSRVSDRRSGSAFVEPSFQDPPPVPALVVSRLSQSQMFIVSAASFDACLYFKEMVKGDSVAVGDSLDIDTCVRPRVMPSHVVTAYRKREPFCDAVVVDGPAGKCVHLTLLVTYKCDVPWVARVVPCYSSGFVDVLDNRRMIGESETGGRWIVRAIQMRDPRDGQKHVWVVAEVIQQMGSAVAIALPSPVKESIEVCDANCVSDISRSGNDAKKDKAIESMDSLRPTPPPQLLEPLDLCAHENPVVAEGDSNTKMMSLVTRILRDRSVRDAMQTANRDIYEELLDRVVGVAKQ